MLKILMLKTFFFMSIVIIFKENFVMAIQYFTGRFFFTAKAEEKIKELLMKEHDGNEK